VKKHDSKEKAKAHLGALEANVDDAKHVKIGAAISQANMKKIQSAHDAMVEMGAACGSEGKSMSSIKMAKMMEMGAVDYAMHEGWDIKDCCQTIMMLTNMCMSAIGEEEFDEAAKLCQFQMDLMDFCKGECQEMMDSISKGKSESYVGKSFATPKELNLSYVKSLGLSKIPDLAAKFVAKDQIKGYAILWGDEKKVDLEKEYFTKDTNFWDNRPQWLTWDHAQDEEFKSDPRIGNILEVGDDEWGKWYVAKLKKAEAYRKYLDDLIERKSIGSSSDSAPQYVKRMKTGKSIWLAEWPLFAVSLTDAPCEPRMIGSLEFLKSLGVQLPDANENHLRFEHKKRQAELLKLKYHFER
jgi:hypothetical protein